MTKLSDATRNKLKTVSTATVATALFKRGFRIQMIQDVHPLGPDQPTLVGEAFTLRYMPAREDLNKIDVFRDRSHPQRKAIEDCPPGAVLVMDSRKDARAASAGAILVTRLMQRGCAGVITDGGFRDSAEIAKLGFPAYHQRPSAPTNLTLHQAIEINVPIGCGDAPVFPGDVILGDSDGVIVIPAHLADEIADEAVEMTAFEDFVTEEVRKGRGDLRALSRDRRADAEGFRGVAEGQRAIVNNRECTDADVQQPDRRRVVVRRRPRAQRQSVRHQGHCRRGGARHARAGRGRDCGGEGRIPGVVAVDAAGPLRHPQEGVGRNPGAQGRAGPAAVARGRQDTAGRRRRSGACGADLCVLCRRMPADGGRETGFRAPRHRHRDHPRSARRRRPDHAVEFPDRDSGLEDRAGAGLRQHRGDQARRPRPRLDLGAGRHPAPRRPARRACSTS